MMPDRPRALGPGVIEVLGDDDLIEVGVDTGITLLRPSGEGRALLVLHQRGPDTTAVLDEADRLSWLAGRSPAPAVVASGRADEGDEAVVLRHPADATPATLGHPMGPEALIDTLAGALRSLHSMDVSRCPFDAGTARLRERVGARIDRGEVSAAAQGPYKGREPAELATLFDELSAGLGSGVGPVFIHAGLRTDRLWFDPSGAASFTGWGHGGVGDRHVDLAAAAALVTELYGPALVAPLFDAYGLDDIDLRRLDSHQLLVHLLT